MQIKTIEQVIKSKLNDWLSTIDDENDASLPNDVRNSLLVSGGSITSMLLNEPVNDYDIYLTDMDVLKRLAKYYVKNRNIKVLDGRDKSRLEFDYAVHDTNNSFAISIRNLHSNQIKLYFESGEGSERIFHPEDNIPELKYVPVFFSPNAISLSNDIQIVLRFTGDVKQIHETFDFVHATNYFTFKDGLVRNLEAMESILTKQLKYQGSHYPVTSIIRAKKFIKRGFNISAGEYLKIIFQVSELDLTNPDTLEEQLIGVDIAYFSLVIDALRTKVKSNPDFKVTSAYVNEIIDRVFNSFDEE